MTNRHWYSAMAAGVVGIGLWLGSGTPAQAENQELNRFYYYPYYYFPHNYWPSQGPKWPEQPGTPYMRPPAYMAYPPFQEPGWRYHAFEPHPYYRGFHFWLDQF
jgi:hypothetical protein